MSMSPSLGFSEAWPQPTITASTCEAGRERLGLGLGLGIGLGLGLGLGLAGRRHGLRDARRPAAYHPLQA